MKRKEDKYRTRVVRLGVIVGLLAAGSVRADFTFGEPTNLGPRINGPGVDASPLVTPDGLELYFCSDQEGGLGEVDLWMCTRLTTDDDWGPPVNLGERVNSPTWDLGPSLSADGLEMYFCRGYGEMADIWVTRRDSINDPWMESINLGPTVNSTVMDCGPCILPDGLTLFFYSVRLGDPPGGDIWMTTRTTVSDSWGSPVNVGSPVNTDTWDYWPSLSAGGRVMMFCSGREGGQGNEDVWMVKRPTTSDAWSDPIDLGPPANTEAWDTCPFVSADGQTYYFVSDRDGGQGSYDLWQAPIEPVIDLNGDGLVDCADIEIMLDNWGTDDSLCDIGPTPFGDGVVDVEDLIVLVEHMTADTGEAQ